MPNETKISILNASMLSFMRDRKKGFTFTQLCDEFANYKNDYSVTMHMVYDCLMYLKSTGQVEPLNTMPIQYRAKM